MLQTLNHASRRRNTAACSPGRVRGLRGLRSSAAFISLGNGSVTAITGNLSIYNYKTYISNENGFLQRGCLKALSPSNYHPVKACPGHATHGVFVLVNGAAAFRPRGDERPPGTPALPGRPAQPQETVRRPRERVDGERPFPTAACVARGLRPLGGEGGCHVGATRQDELCLHL